MLFKNVFSSSPARRGGLTLYQRWYQTERSDISWPQRGLSSNTQGTENGSGSRKGAANWSPTRSYLPVVLFHHKDSHAPYLTAICLIRTAATNKNKRQNRSVRENKITKQSTAPSLCWPLITFPWKMTDKEARRQRRRERLKISWRKEKG